MADRSECYKYTDKMIEPPTRDGARFAKGSPNAGEIEEIKKENDYLKSKIQELTEIVHKIAENQANTTAQKKKQ